MMKLIEGKHYRRRHEQPTLAPHKSKEAVDCLLCSDPGDDDIAPLGHVAMKMAVTRGYVVNATAKKGNYCYR